MTNGYTVSKGADGALIVVLHPKCKISRDEILALLRGLGFDTSKVAFIEPDQAEQCEGLEGTPVIIPIDETTCRLPELDQAGRHCGQAGGRVIVLFGPDYSHEGLHSIADKYGTQCGWSADQLSVRISGQTDQPCTPTGTSKKRTNAKQVNC
jgi:hypothetical protein